jgi:hypothetical protein
LLKTAAALAATTMRSHPRPWRVITAVGPSRSATRIPTSS